jgi:hypothetical protein
MLDIVGLLGKLHESYFGSIFLGVVDELTVIPVASSYVSALDGDGAGPCSPTPYDNSVSDINLCFCGEPACRLSAYLDDLR